MNVVLFPSTDKAYILSQVEIIAGKLMSLGVSCYMDKWFQRKLGHLNITFIDLKIPNHNIDVIVAVGGDGTILDSAAYAMTIDKPVLGINTGRLGFLASIEKDDDGALERFVRGDYFVSKRMTLCVEFHSKNGVFNYTALNDIVLRNSIHTRIADLIVDDGIYGANIRADGIIIATPTGSTAYSLSAGGPIMDPCMEAVIMTTICPHTLSSRAVVYDSDSRLTVTGVHDNEHSSSLIMDIDGKNTLIIQPADKIVISKSPTYAQFIAFEKKSFYEISRSKLTHF